MQEGEIIENILVVSAGPHSNEDGQGADDPNADQVVGVRGGG